MSYGKIIRETTHNISATKGDVSRITFEMIAELAGIKVKDIRAEYETVEDIFIDTGTQHVKMHEAKTKKIANLKGNYALATMIRHDLTLIFIYQRESSIPAAAEVAAKIIAYVHGYIHEVMPKYYFNILVKNPSLIPNKGINAQLYAHFIVHSMFFFSKKELFDINPNAKELQRITWMIIAQLFNEKKDSLEIDNELLE